MQVLFPRHTPWLLALMLSALMSVGVSAQGKAPAPPRPAGEHSHDAQRNTPLTAEQVVIVKAVLAAYKPATLKAEDAKAIKRALRDAGLRHNAALDQAITDAGFSPQKLEALDPRPARPPGAPGDGPPPAPPPPKPADSAPRKP